MARNIRAPAAALRVVTYNVLLGARRREELVAALLARLDADVIALQEVTERSLVTLLARRLKMRAHIGPPSDGSRHNVVILSRLPVVAWHNHRHPDSMLRSHLEVDVTSDVLGGTVGIHCLHLAARFGERGNGEVRRMAEIAKVLDTIRNRDHAPHLILGDFNALAPGDPVAATAFFRRMAQVRRAGLVVTHEGGLVGPRLGSHADPELEAAWHSVAIDPRLDVGIPLLPRIVGPLTGRLPQSERLDSLLSRRLRRSTVAHLIELGYTDCFRQVHPRARGFTCATWMPAARIDYIFATDELAARLNRCEVVGGRGWPDATAVAASDHFPLVAEFRRAARRR